MGANTLPLLLMLLPQLTAPDISGSWSATKPSSPSMEPERCRAWAVSPMRLRGGSNGGQAGDMRPSDAPCAEDDYGLPALEDDVSLPSDIGPDDLKEDDFEDFKQSLRQTIEEGKQLLGQCSTVTKMIESTLQARAPSAGSIIRL